MPRRADHVQRLLVGARERQQFCGGRDNENRSQGLPLWTEDLYARLRTNVNASLRSIASPSAPLVMRAAVRVTPSYLAKFRRLRTVPSVEYRMPADTAVSVVYVERLLVATELYASLGRSMPSAIFTVFPAGVM